MSIAVCSLHDSSLRRLPAERTAEKKVIGGAPLPPGETLPLLGETLTLLKNGFAFVEADPQTRPDLQDQCLFRPTAVITGPNASGLFIDASRVRRSGAM
jgi:hypothetical protein